MQGHFVPTQRGVRTVRGTTVARIITLERKCDYFLVKLASTPILNEYQVRLYRWPTKNLTSIDHFLKVYIIAKSTTGM